MGPPRITVLIRKDTCNVKRGDGGIRSSAAG